jgi:beta-lactamase superfamily II metal-dependent hydrolase
LRRPPRAGKTFSADTCLPSSAEAAPLLARHTPQNIPTLRPAPDNASRAKACWTPGFSSHRNNSSTILLLRSADDHRILLTGDAGVPALNVAAAEYEGRFSSFSSQPLNVFRVPHHGSRSNVSSSLLDRLIGPIGSVETVSAVISSAKASPHHPSPKVTNALLLSGRTVALFVDRGLSILN